MCSVHVCVYVSTHTHEKVGIKVEGEHLLSTSYVPGTVLSIL